MSVVLFLSCSFVGIAILVIRRVIYKGELGGPENGRKISCAIFILLWFVYIIFSCLGQYEYIQISDPTTKDPLDLSTLN